MSHGPEHDFPKLKHQERFYHSDAFFWMPRRVGSAEFAIDSTPTWTERKFYKPPLTIARPHLDDMLPTSLRNERRYQDQERVREHLEKIAVKGAAVQLHWPSSVVLSPHDDYGKRKFLRRLTFLHRVPSDPVHSKACLMVAGKMYYWGEPCPQDLVEVGFVCRTGERADNEIRLANMGSTVIRCVWCKDVHSNHFNKGHYFNKHFIFDSSDRILLPLDQVTLKVQFHANYPGFWREVWHLKTKPALGPDGSSNIPISMWARALVSDDNDRRCRELEEQLDVLVANRIAANINDQLLRNLPYRDYKAILCERFPVTEDMFVVDDVELFEKANPSLSYHGHAMFTIVKVFRKVRELRRPTIAIDLVDDLKQFLLKTQPTSPHKTEESNEREKMQGSPFSNATSISADAVNVSCHIEETDARRLKLSKKGELKNDVIDVQMPSRKINGSRKTEVDELLEGNPADQDPLERRTITVKGLHKMIAGLDERMEEKGRMLMELNEAVSDMSFHRDQPNVHNFKHIVCRTALCQAADDVAGIAQRLRHDMRLNLRPESGRGFKIVTAGHPTSKGEKLYGPNQKEETRHPPMSTPQTVSTVRAKHFTWTSEPISSLISEDQNRKSISDETDDITLMTSTREIERTKSVVTGSHEMYRKVLYELVYERVERLLLDLLPLMTCDQPQLNPLKPRPEL
ncbi:uncharacterized protein LOC112564257 [Pomacea canaliculata]|uniref:uncharacterized protein LOC112564257 n=1 Tax=Pomacea canaliculata TaxID=400727 RepID=UPI000D739304|nr:uncharacterized protein LOC112564257 [Pomacea canaliculata]